MTFRNTTPLLIFALIMVSLSCAENTLGHGADTFMGDWAGSYKADDGEGDFVAQVVALGDSRYRINMLEDFDLWGEPAHILDVVLDGNKLTFTADEGIYEGQGELDGGTLKANYRGPVDGRFEMQRIKRVSPNLGAKPPEDAIVLFDGTGFDNWEYVGGTAGVVDLARIVGGSDCAAYLRNNIWSDKPQEEVLEIGSDDGVKVWLNGRLVHSNNVMRGVKPGEDKVKVSLKKQWNELLLKVTNGAGGWGVSVRLTGAEYGFGEYLFEQGGGRLEGIRERVFHGASDTGTDKYLKKNNGYLTIWDIAGPFSRESKDAEHIFNVAFAPEKEDSAVKWWRVNLTEMRENVDWKLVDGAMEVRGGSIITKRQFKDFERLHVEFRTPYMPKARGQARGNSGVYILGMYEVQILDSYGLEGRDNECGGVYQVAAPVLNMCYPPTEWQAYDITFSAPRFDKEGKKTQNARLTVVHNGVKIHYNIEIPHPTGAARNKDETKPGGIYLQDHGNPVEYRNIWIVE